jgi:dihydroceramidase
MGYWEPHTSSVDFCEPNYQLTPYLAEPHNVWSSGVFVFLGIFGLIHGNPTKEWRFVAYYICLAIIGLGSMALHGTLSAIWQSSDEVPMLWLNIIFIYLLYEANSPKDKPRMRNLGTYLFLTGLIQTILYYSMQSFYPAFLASFIFTLIVVVVWTALIAHENKDPAILPLRHNIWLASFSSGILIASSIWIFEMANCEWLRPMFPFGGASFHIIWHTGAGLGSYLSTVLMTIVRIQAFGQKAELAWKFGLIPIGRIAKGNKKDM